MDNEDGYCIYNKDREYGKAPKDPRPLYFYSGLKEVWDLIMDTIAISPSDSNGKPTINMIEAIADEIKMHRADFCYFTGMILHEMFKKLKPKEN